MPAIWVSDNEKSIEFSSEECEVLHKIMNIISSINSNAELFSALDEHNTFMDIRQAVRTIAESKEENE